MQIVSNVVHLARLTRGKQIVFARSSGVHRRARVSLSERAPVWLCVLARLFCAFMHVRGCMRMRACVLYACIRVHACERARLSPDALARACDVRLRACVGTLAMCLCVGVRVRVCVRWSVVTSIGLQRRDQAD